MSLIQQALEKTHRVKETKVTGAGPSVLDRDPMGAALERELSQVQESYARRRKIFWMISLGVLLMCFVVGLVWAGSQYAHSQAKMPAKTMLPIPHAPLRIISGSIFRLTGITRINGESMAVINDMIVGIGDSLPGHAIVKAIGDGEVRLDVQGRDLQLIL
ncbi:MAG: hypothetical protein V1882_07000 [Candidatus Omnitrophota bacterium]